MSTRRRHHLVKQALWVAVIAQNGTDNDWEVQLKCHVSNAILYFDLPSSYATGSWLSKY